MVEERAETTPTVKERPRNLTPEEKDRFEEKATLVLEDGERAVKEGEKKEKSFWRKLGEVFAPLEESEDHYARRVLEVVKRKEEKRGEANSDLSHIWQKCREKTLEELKVMARDDINHDELAGRANNLRESVNGDRGSVWSLVDLSKAMREIQIEVGGTIDQLSLLEKPSEVRKRLKENLMQIREKWDDLSQQAKLTSSYRAAAIDRVLERIVKLTEELVEKRLAETANNENQD